MTPSRRAYRPAVAAVLLAVLAAGPARAADKWDIARTTIPESVAELKSLQAAVKEVVDKCSPVTVGIFVGMGAGSGVIVSEDGLVLTAAHVSGKAGEECTVVLPSGKRVRAKTLGTNDAVDSGMVQITDPGPNDGKWPFAGRGKSADLKKGQWLVSLGHPGGFRKDRPPVARLGQVQDTGKDLIRTNCTLVGGDSGGPLFDLTGKVVGIHSRIGYTLASNIHVPADSFQREWDQLVGGEEVGKPARPAGAVLGVEFDDDAAAAGGALLKSVEPDDPAGKAGLKAGDILLTFDGKEVDSPDAVRKLLKKKKPGDKVEVTARRGTETVTVTVTLGKRR